MSYSSPKKFHIFKYIFNYDISQIFDCMTIIPITKRLTTINLISNKSNDNNIKNKGTIYSYSPINNVNLINVIKESKNEINYKQLKIKVVYCNNIKLSNDFKYYLNIECFKMIDYKTCLLIEINNNRINTDFSSIFSGFNFFCENVIKFLSYQMKTLQSESITINKSISYIFKIIKNLNLIKNKTNKLKKIHKNDEEIYIIFENLSEKVKIKISIIKINQNVSFIQIIKFIDKKIEVIEFNESKNILSYFLKRLKEIIKNS